MITQFEELVDQFIPTDTSWRGWVKMAFHQPLLPVLPVARELFSKTKLIPSRGTPQADPSPKVLSIKTLPPDDEDKLPLVRATSIAKGWQKGTKEKPAAVMMLPLTDEPESFDTESDLQTHPRRKRLRSLFNRTSTRTDTIGAIVSCAWSILMYMLTDLCSLHGRVLHDLLLLLDSDIKNMCKI